MENNRFDELTRLIASFTSRRSIMQGVAAGGLGSLLGLSGAGIVPGFLDDAEAKKNKKKKRKKRRRKKRRKEKKRRKKCQRKCSTSNVCEEASCNKKGKCKTRPSDDTGKSCSAGTECCSGICACDGGKVGNPQTGVCHQTEFSNPLNSNVDGWFDWDNDADTWPGGTTTIQIQGDHAVLSPAESSEITPMTLWGGYSTVFPAGGFDTSLDIFLDVDAASGTTFRYSSAINKTDCLFLDEAIFVAGTDGGGTFCVSEGGGDPCAGPTPVTITTSGWYTFKHEFRKAGGNSEITLRLLDGNTELGSWVENGGSDVGGNRYGWFPSNAFAALQIRNSSRTPA